MINAYPGQDRAGAAPIANPAIATNYSASKICAGGSDMNLVFSSPGITVLDYPDADSIEIVDKRYDRMTFVRGEVAHRFRAEFEVLSGQEPDLEAYETMIRSFEPPVTYALSFH